MSAFFNDYLTTISPLVYTDSPSCAISTGEELKTNPYLRCSITPSLENMKTLYLLRHAKSSWSFPELPDEQRPLLEKGKKRTRKTIEFMLKKKIVPELILSSRAVRAFETARIVAHGIKCNQNDIISSQNLYTCDTEGIYNELFAISDQIQSVMIVGHNPTLTNFLNKYFIPQVDYLPTSGLAGIQFDTSQWSNLPLAKAKPLFLAFPKEL